MVWVEARKALKGDIDIGFDIIEISLEDETRLQPTKKKKIKERSTIVMT